MVDAAVTAMNDGTSAASDGAPDAPTPNRATMSEAAPWFGRFDGDTQAYLRNKGWTTDNGPAEVVKAYRHLERLQRSEHVAWPKDDKDTEGYARIYDRLGRQKDPTGYGLQAPEGGDRAFVDTMARTFH